MIPYIPLRNELLLCYYHIVASRHTVGLFIDLAALGWPYLRGLLSAPDFSTSMGRSIPLLMCEDGGNNSWYAATGLLGQGRGVMVFSVEADEHGKVQGSLRLMLIAINMLPLEMCPPPQLIAVTFTHDVVPRSLPLAEQCRR